MEQLNTFSVEQIRDVILKYDESLKLYSDNLNSLNVYPVPDGDTGTNMSFTLRSVVDELKGIDDSHEGQWVAIRHGSLMGARGNSGVILSQILRGLADSFSEKTFSLKKVYDLAEKNKRLYGVIHSGNFFHIS